MAAAAAAHDAPFRGVLVGQRQRQGQLHVTTCESALPAQQWRRLRFNYNDDGQPIIIAYDAADTKIVSITSRGSIYIHSVFDVHPLQVIRQDHLVLDCVALSKDSHRYICCGSDQGDIHIWNAFNSQRYTSYKAHDDPVKHIAINTDDSYVSSCCGRSLVFYNLILSKAVHEILHTAITSLVFSSLRKYLVCATDDSGSVTVYDVKSKSVVVRFDAAHNAPATGAAFSPTNKVFFVSCGLDRFVSFYDVGAKMKIATRIQTEAPLTAVQFAPSGACIVLSDSLFQTIVYDLRSTSQPMMKFPGAYTKLLKYVTLPIHQTTEPDETPKASTAGSVPFSTSFFSPIRSTRRSPALETDHYPAPNPANTFESVSDSSIDASKTVTSSSMFSPVRSVGDLRSAKPPSSVAANVHAADSLDGSNPGQSGYSSFGRDSVRDEAYQDRKSMASLAKGSSLFSPIQSRKVGGSAPSLRDKMDAFPASREHSLERKSSPPAEINESAKRKMSMISSDFHSSRHQIEGEDSLKKEMSDKESAHCSSSDISRQIVPAGEPLVSDDLELETNFGSGTLHNDLENARGSVSTTKDEEGAETACIQSEKPPIRLEQSTAGSSDLPSRSLGADAPASTGFPLQTLNQAIPAIDNPIQADVIRSALDESIANIRNDIRNLHLDMIRYFHGQKMELASQFNAELERLRLECSHVVAENQKLREQIERFGSFPISGSESRNG